MHKDVSRLDRVDVVAFFADRSLVLAVAAAAAAAILSKYKRGTGATDDVHQAVGSNVWIVDLLPQQHEKSGCLWVLLVAIDFTQQIAGVGQKNMLHIHAGEGSVMNRADANIRMTFRRLRQVPTMMLDAIGTGGRQMFPYGALQHIVTDGIMRSQQARPPQVDVKKAPAVVRAIHVDAHFASGGALCSKKVVAAWQHVVAINIKGDVQRRQTSSQRQATATPANMILFLGRS